MSGADQALSLDTHAKSMLSTNRRLLAFTLTRCVLGDRFIRIMSVVTFTPLGGCGDGDPLCYLLTIDECNILLDCGEPFSQLPTRTSALPKYL